MVECIDLSLSKWTELIYFYNYLILLQTAQYMLFVGLNVYLGYCQILSYILFAYNKSMYTQIMSWKTSLICQLYLNLGFLKVKYIKTGRVHSNQGNKIIQYHMYTKSSHGLFFSFLGFFCFF